MLWGRVYAKFTKFHDRSAATLIFILAPGVGGAINNAFCYIGTTATSFYIGAVDPYNTDKKIGEFTIPYSEITALKVYKSSLGGEHRVEIDCGERITLAVKSLSLGTNIKDQKERFTQFIADMNVLKTRFQ